VFCFLGGPSLIAWGLLGFEHSSGFGRRLRSDSGQKNYYLYYPDAAKLLIVIGIILIGIGLLRKYWSRQKSD